MKKLLCSLMIIFTAFVSRAQIVTGSIVDEVGSKKTAILSSSALVSKQDSIGGVGANTYVTPTYLLSRNYASLTALSAVAPVLYNNTTGMFSLANLTFTATGDVTGTAAGTSTISPALTLAAVGTSGTYTYPSSVTTDTKGRVTAITAGPAPLFSTGRVEITATAAQTTFTAAGLPASPGMYHFFRNGVLLPLANTTVSAGSVSLSTVTTTAGDAITIDWVK
jgi:hypothetical protein